MANAPEEPAYLTKATLIEANVLLGCEGRLRDENLLESALAAPQYAVYYGGELSLVEQAAILTERLALNHPFIDGNKRVALLAGSLFLLINGSQILYQAEAAEVPYGLEIEHLILHRDLTRLRHWLESHLQPYSGGDKIDEALQLSMQRFARDLEYLGR